MKEHTDFEYLNYIKEPCLVCNIDGQLIFGNKIFCQNFTQYKKKSDFNVISIFKKKEQYIFKEIIEELNNQNEYSVTLKLKTSINKSFKFELKASKINENLFFVLYPIEETGDEQTLAYLTSKITSTLDLDYVLNLAIEELRKVFNFSGYNICLLDEEEHQLRVLKFFHPGLNKESINFFRTVKYPLNKDGGVLADALIKNKVIYIKDREKEKFLSNSVKLAMVNLDIRSQLVFPMEMEGRGKGVIAFYTQGNEILEVTEDDITRIKRFIFPITIAINNSVLHSQVLRQAVELELKVEERTVQLTRTLEELEKLNLVTMKINASLNLDEVLDLLIKELRKLFFFEGFAIMLADEKQENLFTIKLDIPHLPKEKVEEIKKMVVPLDVTIGGGVVISYLWKKDFYFENIDLSTIEEGPNKEIIKLTKMKSNLIMPLIVHEKAIGVMVISTYSKNLGFTKEDIKTIQRFVAQISSAVKNSHLYYALQQALEELDKKTDALESANVKLKQQKELLQELSITDSLTGIRNRRYFNERIKEEFTRCDRYNKNIFIIMLDIDNFKSVNDTYGHDFGDYVLVSFTDILKHSIRTSDMLARYGGEEFIIAMFETDIEGAKMICERIRENVEKCDFTFKNITINRTISIGISCFPSPVCKQEDIETVIKEADEALYLAKNSGKNRWVYYYDVEDKEIKKK